MTPASTDTRSTTEANKAIVRRFVDEVFVGGRSDAVDELVGPDFVPHNWGKTGPGPDELKRAMKRVSAGLSDVRMTIDDMIAEDDRVVVRLTARALQSGEFMGLPPSGKSYEVSEIHIFRVDGGRIVEHWAQVDMLGIMQQLGAMPGGQAGGQGGSGTR